MKQDSAPASSKELTALKQRIAELEAEVAQLTTDLHATIDQNTQLCEKVILAETQRDDFKDKLQVLKDKNQQHLTQLNASLVLEEDAGVRSQIEAAEAMQRTIQELEDIGQAADSTMDAEETASENVTNSAVNTRK